MLIEQKINELLEKRGTKSKTSKDSSEIVSHVEDETKKKLSFSVSEMLESSKLSDKIRGFLENIRSLGNVSLVYEVENFFKSLCKEDVGYQKIFDSPVVLNDPADNYFAVCDRLFKAALFLRINDKFAEVKQTVTYLKNLDKGEFHPLSDEAIRKKLSKN